MLPLSRVTKDPESTLDYVCDWSDWLSTSNDRLTSVVWLVPPGVRKTSQSVTDTTATVWVTGGTLKRIYAVTCRATTLAGRTDDYTFEIVIQDK